jgi:hypothetical protein
VIIIIILLRKPVKVSTGFLFVETEIFNKNLSPTELTDEQRFPGFCKLAVNIKTIKVNSAW